MIHFTKKEEIWNRVSFDRLLEIIRKPHIEVMRVELQYINDYGDWTAVTVEDTTEEGRKRHVIFVGCGWSEVTEEWKTDFGFYYPNTPKSRSYINKTSVEQELNRVHHRVKERQERHKRNLAKLDAKLQVKRFLESQGVTDEDIQNITGEER